MFRYNIVKMSGNTWTNFVKDWAKENNTTYMCAIGDPNLSIAYKQNKKDTKRDAKASSFTSLKDAAVALAEEITPPVVKKSRGRPSKYTTDEERKKAKREKTVASTRANRERQKVFNKKQEEDEKERDRIEKAKPPTIAMVEQSKADKLQAENEKLEKKLANETELYKLELKRRKDDREKAEKKEISDKEKRELIITPQEVKKLLADTTRKSKMVQVNNIPMWVGLMDKHPNRPIYADPYNGDIKQSVILKDDVKLYPFEYFLPKGDKAVRIYKSYNGSGEYIDPDTLQSLGFLREVSTYNREIPHEERAKRIPLGIVDGRNWFFDLTPLGKQRLEEYMKEDK